MGRRRSCRFPRRGFLFGSFSRLFRRGFRFVFVSRSECRHSRADQRVVPLDDFPDIRIVHPLGVVIRQYRRHERLQLFRRSLRRQRRRFPLVFIVSRLEHLSQSYFRRPGKDRDVAQRAHFRRSAYHRAASVRQRFDNNAALALSYVLIQPRCARYCQNLL